MRPFLGGIYAPPFADMYQGRSQDFSKSILDYPDSLGSHEIVRIIEASKGPDNRKYEY